MATHSSILAWKIPWTEELGGLYSSWGHKQLDTTERLTHTHTLHMPKLLLLHWKVSFISKINFEVRK